jgi:hypothetical protein
MSLIDGYLTLCSAISGATVTEVAGVTRQPMSFGNPLFGGSVNSRHWTFGAGLVGPYAGRAVYDSPTGGKLLLVIPFSAARPQPGSGPCDAGDVADICISFDALSTYESAAPYSGTFAAGATIGTCWDRQDVIGGGYVLATDPANYTTLVHTSPLVCGVGLTLSRGVLQVT